MLKKGCLGGTSSPVYTVMRTLYTVVTFVLVAEYIETTHTNMAGAHHLTWSKVRSMTPDLDRTHAGNEWNM